MRVKHSDTLETLSSQCPFIAYLLLLHLRETRRQSRRFLLPLHLRRSRKWIFAYAPTELSFISL